MQSKGARKRPLFLSRKSHQSRRCRQDWARAIVPHCARRYRPARKPAGAPRASRSKTATARPAHRPDDFVLRTPATPTPHPHRASSHAPAHVAHARRRSRSRASADGSKSHRRMRRCARANATHRRRRPWQVRCHPKRKAPNRARGKTARGAGRDRRARADRCGAPGPQTQAEGVAPHRSDLTQDQAGAVRRSSR